MEHYYHYCERGGDPGIWAEPLNAVTNLAFLGAAAMTANLLRSLPFRQGWDVYLLCIVLACIGIGSGLWHTAATPLTELLDVIPITLFINGYFITFLWRGFGLRWWQVLIAWGGLQAANVAAGMAFSMDTLNGTIMYLPTYAALSVISLAAFRYKKWFRLHLLLLLALWTCSLIFRTIDLPLCDVTGIGTHYLWHIANAVVLYKLLVILLRLATKD